MIRVTELVDARLKAIVYERKVLQAELYKRALEEDPNTVFAVAERGPISLDKKVPVYQDREQKTLLFLMEPGDSIRVLDYTDVMYVLNLDSTQGFSDYYQFKSTPQLTTFRNMVEARKQEIEAARRAEVQARIDAKQRARERQIAAEERQKEQRRQQQVKALFIQSDAERIIDRQIWIGMTDQMASYSIGSPLRKNKSVYSFGVMEQWVYGDAYLYFENGVLTSYQYTE